MATLRIHYNCSRHPKREIWLTTKKQYADLQRQLLEAGWWTNGLKVRCPACVQSVNETRQTVQALEIKNEELKETREGNPTPDQADLGDGRPVQDL